MSAALPDPPDPHEGGRPQTSLLPMAVSGIVTAVLLVPVFRLWRATLDIPLDYRADAAGHAVLVKAVIEHGWYENNPSLGAPFSMVLHDFPVGDHLHLVLMKLIGHLGFSYGATINIYYLASYVLTAVVATWAVRKLGSSTPTAVVMGVLYAYLPYHFTRGESHLFLGAYYVVPLAVYLGVMVLRGGGELLPRTDGSGVRRYLPVLRTAAFCVLIGSASAYYGVFTALLLGVAAVVGAVAWRSWRVLVLGGGIAALVLGVVVANVIPDLLYIREHGRNAAVRAHAPGDPETYATKLAQLVLPMPMHRIDRLAALRQRYERDYPLPSEQAAMGAVASVGFVALLCLLFIRALRPPRDALDRRFEELAVLAGAGFLIGTVGGVSTLIALVVTTQVRAWNRLSVFIAFASLTAVAFAVDRVTRLLRGRRFAPMASAALVVLLGVGGLIDQTSNTFVPGYEETAAEFTSDREFVRRIERTLGEGAMVYQLPRVLYPEAAAPGRMVDYDEMRGYLHSDSLRWSYGAMKGRPASNWQDNLTGKPVPELLRTLVAIGFTGLYTDRWGYDDNGAALEAEVAAATGASATASRNGRLSFFDLRAYRDRITSSTPASELEAVASAALGVRPPG